MALVHKLIWFLSLWHQLRDRERISAAARFTARKPCWARSSPPEVFARPWLTHWSQTGRFNFDCCLHLFDFIDHCARINNRLYWYHLQMCFFAWRLFPWRHRECKHVTQPHCDCSKQKKGPSLQKKTVVYCVPTQYKTQSVFHIESTKVLESKAYWLVLPNGFTRTKNTMIWGFYRNQRGKVWWGP